MNINNSFQQLPDKFIPPNEKTTIWRYLDFTKFMVLLDSGKLFFSRCDKLGDSWEGSCPKKTEKRRVGILGDASSSFKLLREFTSVNCWHMNKYESMAMWEIYIKNNEGIAIKSSIKRLNESLSFQNISKEEFFYF